MFVVLCGILINESQKETNQSLCTESDMTSYKRVCFKAMFFNQCKYSFYYRMKIDVKLEKASRFYCFLMIL